MNARYVFLLALAGLISAPAYAEISYDYAELRFGAVDVDVILPQNGEGTGPEGFASYQFYGPFVAFAGAKYTDYSDDKVELTDTQLGLGITQSLGKNASMFLNVSYLWTEIETETLPTFDQDGYGVTLGYRAENHSPWEFIGTIDYINVESGVEVGAGMSLLYDATRRVGIVGGFNYFDTSMSAFLGVRYFFNHRH